MTSSDTSSAENLNNTDRNPAEPDDGPILEQLDDKRCGICHEIIMKACRVSCGHRFCRYCLDRKRSSESFKPGENGTPKCNVCNAAINEVQNLSELDKEIDELYSNLPMKARLDRAALKAQRERQVDAWKRRSIHPPSSATKPSTTTRPTTTTPINSSLPFPSRRREEYLVTPRRNRGMFPERQRSYLDMYRENINVPQRQRSSPHVQLLFQDASRDIGSSSEEGLHSRYDFPTSNSDLLASAASRSSNSSRRSRRNPRSTRAESLLSHSQASITSESNTPASTSSSSFFRPVVIHETYTIRRTRVLNASHDTEDTFSPQVEHRTESNYLNDTEFQEPEYEAESQDTYGFPDTRSPSEIWRAAYNDLLQPNQRTLHRQYQSPWDINNSMPNYPVTTPVPPHLNATLPNWYFGVDPEVYSNINSRPGYYNFLPQVATPPVATPPPPHWIEQHTSDSFMECNCSLCYSRRHTTPNSYYEQGEPTSYFETSGVTSSEELHPSGSHGYFEGAGYQYPGEAIYPEYEQDDSTIGNYDPLLYPLMSDDNEERAFSQSGVHMNVNYNYGYSADPSGDVVEDSNYFGAPDGGAGYYQQHPPPGNDNNNWSQQPEYQNIVDSFYSSNAAAAAAATPTTEEGAAATCAGGVGSFGRSTRRHNNENYVGSTHQRLQSTQRSREGPREFGGGEITPASRGRNGSNARNPPMASTNSRDPFDFDEFGPEIAVTEAIIGFRR